MDNSPLRKLSPELRNFIYEEVFTGSVVYLDHFKDGVGALVQTCREVRQEAWLLLFGKADIQIKYNGYSKFFRENRRKHGLTAAFKLAPVIAQAFVETLHETFDEAALKANGRRPIPIAFWEHSYLRLDCPECNSTGRGVSAPSNSAAVEGESNETGDGGVDEAGDKDADDSGDVNQGRIGEAAFEASGGDTSRSYRHGGDGFCRDLRTLFADLGWFQD